MSSRDEIEDADLLEAARTGDECAFGHLLAPHWRSVKVFCGLMLGDAAAAECALAETVGVAQCEVELVESAACVRMWIHRIAAHVCVAAADRPESPVTMELTRYE